MVLKVEKLVGLLTPLLESDQLNSKARKVRQKWIYSHVTAPRPYKCAVCMSM